MLNGGGLLYTLKKQDPFFKKTSDLLSNKIGERLLRPALVGVVKKKID